MSFADGGWKVYKCLLLERLDAWSCFPCKVYMINNFELIWNCWYIDKCTPDELLFYLPSTKSLETEVRWMNAQWITVLLSLAMSVLVYMYLLTALLSCRRKRGFEILVQCMHVFLYYITEDFFLFLLNKSLLFYHLWS